MNAMTYPPGTRWRYSSRRYGNEKVGELALDWELLGDPISDDCLPEDVPAPELLRRWLDWIWDAEAFDKDLGVPHVPIYWFVSGPDAATFEAAPPIIPLDNGDNFTTFFTHPEDEQTGEPINWLRLPVVDKLWRTASAVKGGFVQEATGFKPSAFQPALDLRVLSAAAIDWSRQH